MLMGQEVRSGAHVTSVGKSIQLICEAQKWSKVGEVLRPWGISN